MNRFFTEDIAGGEARITGEDVRHITRVLRLAAGDRIAVCDGHGTEYDAAILRASESEVVCSLSAARRSESEPVHAVTLFQGLPKAGKMETIVQKCVELGAVAIVPTLCSRCVALPTRDYEKKRQR